jgi:hypothetical protein
MCGVNSAILYCIYELEKMAGELAFKRREVGSSCRYRVLCSLEESGPGLLYEGEPTLLSNTGQTTYST